MNCDICIIGAGIAGLTAAIYARRAGHSVVLVEKNMYGGQMVQSADIENYPGILKTTGPELSFAVYEQAEKQGAQLVFDTVEKLEREANGWKVCCAADTVYAGVVIVANGASHRHLGCDGEERLTGRGVSYCATCDGAFFRGKHTAVVGGGNTALEDALFLSNMCEKVYVIHRRDEFRGDKVLVDAVKARENIELVLSANVKEICGEASVSDVRLAFADGTERHIDLNAVFIAVGVVPDTAIVQNICRLDDSGYIIADENGETGVEGLYAAGDCRSKRLRQIVTAAADGANSAFSASGYLNASKGK